MIARLMRIFRPVPRGRPVVVTPEESAALAARAEAQGRWLLKRMAEKRAADDARRARIQAARRDALDRWAKERGRAR